MKLFIMLGKANLAKALDIKGRNKAVAANSIPIISILGSVTYWVITRDGSLLSVLLGVMAILGSFVVGMQLQATAVIESIYRCKDGKNKKIYERNKAYFDKKFLKLVGKVRPCTKQHIIEQQGRW